MTRRRTSGFPPVPDSFISQVTRICLLLWFAIGGQGCIDETTPTPPQRVVEQIGPLLEDPNLDVRRTAALSLGKIKHPSAVPALVKGLDDPDSRVRRYSAWGLGNLGERLPQEASLHLAQTLATDPDPLVQEAAAHALSIAQPPTEILKPLQIALQAPDAARRRAAAQALRDMNHTIADRLLTERLHDADAMVRQHALATLGELADPRALPPIRILVTHDPDPGVRAEAAFRLGKLGGHDDIPVLEVVVSTDPDASVRRWASWAITYIDPTRTKVRG